MGMPVSYTHLDVYKRQVPRTFHTSLGTDVTVSDNEYGYRIDQDAEPVSYTHLDVYKRQASDYSGLCITTGDGTAGRQTEGSGGCSL